jgi:subtilisin family serine protease
VAIIEGGISRHEWLDGAYVTAPNDREPVPPVIPGTPDRLGDQAGHALFLTGLVLQQAPSATVIVFKTADLDGMSAIDTVARAIRLAVSCGVDVINLSLGCYTANDLPPWILEDALAEVPPTTAIVASAGNAAQTLPFWPAAFPGVTAVGALNGTKVASYSNDGPWIQVYVEATDVVSTYLDRPGVVRVPQDDGTVAFDERPYAGWASWSGTSMAAATWSGVIARVAWQLGVDAAQAERLIWTRPDAVGLDPSFTPEPKAPDNVARRAFRIPVLLANAATEPSAPVPVPSGAD